MPLPMPTSLNIVVVSLLSVDILHSLNIFWNVVLSQGSQ